MKTIQSIVLAIIAECLCSCMSLTPNQMSSLGGDYESIDIEWGKRATIIKANHSKVAGKTLDTGKSMLNTYGLFKAAGRYFDSKDAETAASAATSQANAKAATDAAKIAADKEISLKAMEMEVPTVPAP